jgi:hypothetical protein
LDTIGVIQGGPLALVEAILFPNAAADAATLGSWNEGATPKSSVAGGTVSVTSTNTITCSGAFTTGKVAVGDIIRITKSPTGNNLGWYLVATRSSDNAIIITGAALSNDTGSVYDFSIWTPQTELYLKAEGTTGAVAPFVLPFMEEGGRKFNNLVLLVIDRSAKVELLLKG